MLYKSITLSLLEERSDLYQQLQSQRKLMEMLDLYSGQLKASHERWTTCLWNLRPGSDETQLKSEAMELAISELEASLPPASPSPDRDHSSPESVTASPPA